MIGYPQIFFSLPKKKLEGELLILELLLESISAFLFRKTHFASNLGSFPVILPSLARRAYCMSIFSPKLPTILASLIAEHGLVCISTNSSTTASIFGNFYISAKQTAICFTKIVTRIVIANKQLYFAFQLHFSVTIATEVSPCYSRDAFS